MNTKNILAVLLAAGMAWACKSETTKDGKPLDTPTTGEITVGVDESFEPLLRAEVEGFGILYKQATIKTVFKPEGEVIADLLKDSIRMAIAARPFTEGEKVAMKQQTITPREYPIAVDAVCLIVNKKNIDTVLSVTDVKNLLVGTTKKWSDLSKTNLKDSVRIVFDNNNSSNLLFLKDKLGLKDTELGKHVFAVKSNAEVIEYIKNHPNSMGVIGINWITDSTAKEKELKGFMKDNAVVAVVPDSLTTTPDWKKTVHIPDFYPYQSSIALKTYPFRRMLYVLSREARSGLGTGFTSYILGDKGQRIVLRAGLLPINAPVRLIEMKNKKIEIEK